MNQQINLFLQLPRPKVETGKYTVKNMLIATAVVVVVVLGYALYINIKASTLTNDVVRLKADKEAAQKKYDETSAQYPAEAKAALVNQAKDIEQQIAVKKALLTLLQNSSLGTNGFAEKLQALSDDVQPGMWLTHIEFNLTKQYIGLAGIGIDTNAVLAFVDKLGKNPAFANEKFATFKIDKPENAADNSAFSFVLSNKTGDEPAKPEVPAPAAPNPAPSAEPAAAPAASAGALNVNTPSVSEAPKKSAVTMVPEDEGGGSSAASSSQSGGSNE